MWHNSWTTNLNIYTTKWVLYHVLIIRVRTTMVANLKKYFILFLSTKVCSEDLEAYTTVMSYFNEFYVCIGCKIALHIHVIMFDLPILEIHIIFGIALTLSMIKCCPVCLVVYIYMYIYCVMNKLERDFQISKHHLIEN